NAAAVHPVAYARTTDELAQLIRTLPHHHRLVVFYDANLPTEPIKTLSALLSAHVPQCFFYPQVAGESCKDLSAAVACWTFLQEKQIGRKDTIMAIGGGTLLDLIGFVASVYHRGIDFISVPTSLLAQVDAAIGGKNALNFSGVKNMLGTVTYPTSVWIHTPFVATQSDEHYQEGLVELLKIALVRSPSLTTWLEQVWPDLVARKQPQLNEAVKAAIELKLTVVANDSKKTRLRDCLNFGHTFAHALEAYYGPSLSHGTAVALGLRWILRVSQAELGLDKSIIAMVNHWLNQLTGLITPATAPEWAQLLGRIQQDKKKSSPEQIRLILLQGLGEWRAQDVSPEKTLALLEHYGPQLWKKQ
ncbi:MAG: 3-dehydroquinate synthase family protein, partial [Pseudomonadota bacterium]